MRFIERNRYLAPTVVRVAISLVFLWFGLTQIFNPQMIAAYAPVWAENFPLGGTIGFVQMNGIFETIFGTLLILGLFTRVSAFLLAIHLLGIISQLGYNDIAVRDVGLMLVTIGIWLHGPDEKSLDSRIKPKLEGKVVGKILYFFN